MKKCDKCFISKDLSEFNKSPSHKLKTFPYCKSCKKEYDRLRYEKKTNSINKERQTIKSELDEIIRNKKKGQCTYCAENNSICMSLCCFNSNTGNELHKYYINCDKDNFIKNQEYLKRLCHNCQAKQKASSVF